MKRASSGTKRKQAQPARRPALKRSPRRSQAKAAPAAPKKRVSVKKTKPAAKVKVTKTKPAQRKVARRKVAKPIAGQEMLQTPVVATVAPKAKRQPGRKISARTKAAAPIAIAASPVPVVPTPVANLEKRKRRRTATSARIPARNIKPAVPAFLLEGDEPTHATVGGPGEKFSLGPTPPLDHFDEASVPLPESYGTGRLFLTARDPHWLYAHWDFTREEQFRHNARSVDRHLVLRVHHSEPVTPQPAAHIAEYHVHPESKHWFVHVEQAGEPYRTELGYYQAGRKWKSLTFSAPQRTPPDNISADAKVEFATIPLELPFETMLALLKETAGEAIAQNTPLAHAVDRIRPQAREHFPRSPAPGEWTSEQEQALQDVLAADRARASCPSSEEFVSEQPWPEFAFDYETGEAAPLPAPTSYVSSFFGGEGQKDFWFNINAELIIYGATEPNATVTFAGKPVPLRKDGSFRFHFALPDGAYELPVTAVSADGTDGRAVELKFSRVTEMRGHVAAAPVDPALKAPPGESA